MTAYSGIIFGIYRDSKEEEKRTQGFEKGIACKTHGQQFHQFSFSNPL
jgi:hypothetical protein